MRLKLALLTTALAFGLGTTAALAEDAPGAKSDITIVESNPSANNVPGTAAEEGRQPDTPVRLTAPEKSGSAQPQQCRRGRARQGRVSHSGRRDQGRQHVGSRASTEQNIASLNLGGV